MGETAAGIKAGADSVMQFDMDYFA